MQKDFFHYEVKIAGNVSAEKTTTNERIARSFFQKTVMRVMEESICNMDVLFIKFNNGHKIKQEEVRIIR